MIASFTSSGETRVICVISSIVLSGDKILITSSANDGYWEIEFKPANETFRGYKLTHDDYKDVEDGTFNEILLAIEKGGNLVDIDDLIGRQYDRVIRKALGLNG